MADYLYKKLSNIDILRRAWHLSINDARDNFLNDQFNYSDFAFNLEENLSYISRALKTNSYHPSPLINIDVPKSTLSVRPGSVAPIEDMIVMFGITMLIAQRLDKKLPDGVYSYRLKDKPDKRSLFKDLELLKFPFLKSKTIRRRVDILESWYSQWSRFIKETIYTFEKQGYRYMSVSDISAYFENINLDLLRDILLKHLPKEQRIINFLSSVLEYWTWPTVHGLPIERGIPQGNDVSSFLGNIYLLPLDEEFISFAKKRNIKYFRYMDDVKIFAKDPRVAREVVFVMNNVLRKLHLNIQGNKTMILEGDEIRKELIDKRLDQVNRAIEDIQKNINHVNNRKRNKCLRIFETQYRRIKKTKRIIQGKDLRLYRRLITGFTLLQSPFMVRSILNQIRKNPDARLTNKMTGYFKYLPNSSKTISRELFKILNSSIALFHYQECKIIMALRYVREVPTKVFSYIYRRAFKKTEKWFIRVECILLLSNLPLKSIYLSKLKKLYGEESNVEVKRALIKCLCQLEKVELDKFLRNLLFDNNKKLSSLGRMLLCIQHNQNNAALNEISNLFRHFEENILLESYYKVNVMRHTKDKKVRQQLLKKLKIISPVIKRSHLNKHISNVISELEAP